MLVFVDESGDTGLSIAKGSSKYFVVALVIFEEHTAAADADEKISLLRRNMSTANTLEFHFQKNSQTQRIAFLRAVAGCDFKVFAFVVNKQKLRGDCFANKSSFYKQICKFVFENAREHNLLFEAKVKFDKCGDVNFNKQLKAYLKRQINQNESRDLHIADVSSQDSKGDNLIQLADMICGAVARSYYPEKPDHDLYLKIIKRRIVSQRFWP
jgi:hypothetical protein